MKTHINSSAQLLIDTEFANIPYSEETLRMNQQLGITRSEVPVSRIEHGKFRRLFNRHTTAFRRR